jgi:dipeptidyl aminopeptidase/acylaminoacyl peptidase
MVGIYDFIDAWGKRSLQLTLSDMPLGSAFAESIEQGPERFLKPFWQVPETYIRNSPIFGVEELDAPLLMLHGDLDAGPTDLSGGERMYTALLRTGKKPVLVHYWGEGHSARSASAMRDQWKRITAWFGHYLKGEPVRSW